jgi:hypothetical protein
VCHASNSLLSAVAAAVCAASTADATPRKKRVVQVTTVQTYPGPRSTTITSRDDTGRTRTKILVQKLNAWVNALTSRPLEVYPTHWKDWFDSNEVTAQFNRSTGIKNGLIAAQQARRIFNAGLICLATRIPAAAE